tara:strand:+ start:129 stop:545 length:417 start_codon:yes stop_codon:yes gene_type:complete
MIEANRQLDVVAQFCLITIAILFLFIIYIVCRAVFTKSEDLPTKPGHITNATVILQWVAGTSLILSFLAICFDAYDQLLFYAVRGSIESYHLTGLLFNSLVLFGIGLWSALMAMIGIAIIFMKKLRFEKLEQTSSSTG